MESVLLNWKEAGVKTLDDARLFEKQFKESRKKRTYLPKNYGSSKKDITPDWYIRQKEEQRKKEQERKDQPISEEERKRNAEEAERMLREYLEQNS